MRSITLTIAIDHIEQLKLYALQRKDKIFSNKLYKIMNNFENSVFEEPKLINKHY